MANELDLSVLRKVTAGLTAGPAGEAQLAAAHEVIARASVADHVQTLGAIRDLHVPLTAEADKALADLTAAAVASKRPAPVVVRRNTPFPGLGDGGAGVSLSAGQRISRTLGPFRDTVDQSVWFDVIDPIATVAFARPGQTAPFLLVQAGTLPASTAAITLGPGSVWIASALLAPGAPANGFTGLEITGGTLTLGTVVATSGSPIVVPASVSMTLALKLAQGAAATGTGSGADARAQTLVTPAQVTIRLDASGATFSGVGSAKLTVFGTTYDFTFTATHAAFDAVLGRLALPASVTPAAVAIAGVKSTLFMPAGKVPIVVAGWSLPVATANPASLGAASGAGGLGFLLADGVHAAWHEREPATQLGLSILLALPGLLTLLTGVARNDGAPQRFALWGDAASRSRGTLAIAFPKRFGLIWISNAAGAELLQIDAPGTLSLDRPVTVAGHRVPLAFALAQTNLLQHGADLVLTFGGLDATPPTRKNERSFAVENAVLKTGPVALALLAVELEGANKGKGGIALESSLLLLLPILPDPYASNVVLRARSVRAHEPIGPSVAVLAWKANGPPTIDWLLPGNALGGLTQSVAPVAAAPSPPPAATGAAAAFENQVDPKTAALLSADAATLRAFDQMADRTVLIGRGELHLLDVSSNADRFGIEINALPAFEQGSAMPALSVQKMQLTSEQRRVRIFTLPAVQWEPLISLNDNPDVLPLATPLTYPDCGGPSEITVGSTELVPVTPRDAIRAAVIGYNRSANPIPLAMRFTLPFGIEAFAVVRHEAGTASPSVGFASPSFGPGMVRGGIQISVRAGLAPPGGRSRGLPGAAVQLHNALHDFNPTSDTALTPIDMAFNARFAPGGPVGAVPVERFDLSGYGESVISEWRDPADAAGIISKAQFAVLLGRTALEIVQERSILYPHGARVVRTITIERRNTARVVRHDSGWQAVTDGEYAYPNGTVQTHPGVVRAARNVRHIRDTSQTVKASEGSTLMVVYFDCDLEVEHAGAGSAGGLVPGRNQIGLVQLDDKSNQGALTSAQLADVLTRTGPLGGPIDCDVDVGGTGQHMRVTHVSCAGTVNAGATSIAMAAWGSPRLPGGGQWSFLRQTSSLNDLPVAVDKDRGVPLTRTGLASAPDPSQPYRFADPEDVSDPAHPAHLYGVLHATGTQRVLFLGPHIAPSAPFQIAFDRAPLLADPFTLVLAGGLFPKSANAIPFPNASFTLALQSGGNYKLTPAADFPSPVAERAIATAPPNRAFVRYRDEDGHPTQVKLAIDTGATPDPWSFALSGFSLVGESGAFGEIMRIKAGLISTASHPTQLTNAPGVVLGGALKPVQEALNFLESFASGPPLNVAMTNDWQITAGLDFPAAKVFEKSLKALIPILDDLDLKIVSQIYPSVGPTLYAKYQFSIEAVLKWPTVIPAVFGFGALKLTLVLAVDAGGGGVGAVFTIEFGIGLGFSTPSLFGLFEAKAYLMENIYVVLGDNIWALGLGIMLKGDVDLTIAEVELSLELRAYTVHETCMLPDGQHKTGFAVGQFVVELEVHIAWIFDFDFQYTGTMSQNLDGGPCALQDFTT
jgi:hypothetical protein